MSSSKIISRKEAKVQGLKRYYTGKPCRRGHIAERRVSSTRCSLCCSERRLRDREKRIKWCREWREKYPERSKESKRKWRANPVNHQLEIESMRKYRENHPDIFTKHNCSKRKKKKSDLDCAFLSDTYIKKIFGTANVSKEVIALKRKHLFVMHLFRRERSGEILFSVASNLFKQFEQYSNKKEVIERWEKDRGNWRDIKKEGIMSFAKYKDERQRVKAKKRRVGNGK